MATARRRNLLLILILLLAGSLRFSVIGHGRPRHLNVDERTTNRLVGGVLAGRGWNLRHWLWPNLNAYLSVAVCKSADRVAGSLGITTPDRYLLGRGYAAAMGVVAVLLLYLAAARLFDSVTGLLSAAFLAVMPLHVEYSHWWLTDGPMATFYILAVWLAIRLADAPTPWRWAMAGAAVGLATATKYNGAGAGLAVVCAGVLILRQQGRRRLPHVLAGLVLSGLTSVAVFFLANPYALLDQSKFLANLHRLGGLYGTGSPTGFLGWHVLRHVLGSFWRADVGRLLCLLALVGGVVLIARPLRQLLLALVLPAALLVLLGSTVSISVSRNFLFLLPHIAMLAAVGAGAAGRGLEGLLRRRWPQARLAGAVWGGLVLVAMPPSLAQSFAMRQGDTRFAAYDWILGNVPQGSRILWEYDMVNLPYNLYNTNKRQMDVGYSPPQWLVENFDYVVACSTSYQYTLRQSDRPGFAERAAIYRALFDSPQFQLMARFEPQLWQWGPEVRVYRNMGPQGLPVADGPQLLTGRLWSRPRKLADRKSGVYDFDRNFDMVSGGVWVAEPGRYALELTVRAEEPFPLMLGLGRHWQTFWIAGEQKVALEHDLPRGPVRWQVAVGRRARPGTRVTLWGVRLAHQPDATPRVESGIVNGDQQ